MQRGGGFRLVSSPAGRLVESCAWKAGSVAIRKTRAVGGQRQRAAAAGRGSAVCWARLGASRGTWWRHDAAAACAAAAAAGHKLGQGAAGRMLLAGLKDQRWLPNPARQQRARQQHCTRSRTGTLSLQQQWRLRQPEPLNSGACSLRSPALCAANAAISTIGGSGGRLYEAVKQLAAPPSPICAAHPQTLQLLGQPVQPGNKARKPWQHGSAVALAQLTAGPNELCCSPFCRPFAGLLAQRCMLLSSPRLAVRPPAPGASQNGLAEAVQKSRKQIKERKNRNKPLRGVKKAGGECGRAREHGPGRLACCRWLAGGAGPSLHRAAATPTNAEAACSLPHLGAGNPFSRIARHLLPASLLPTRLDALQARRATKHSLQQPARKCADRHLCNESPAAHGSVGTWICGDRPGYAGLAPCLEAKAALGGGFGGAIRGGSSRTACQHC